MCCVDTYALLRLIGWFGSDNESLEGLQQELEDCKNDEVMLLALYLVN